MVQRGQNLGFALKARETIGMLRDDRYFAAELGVLAAVDLAHAAFAQRPNDLIVAQARPDWGEGFKPPMNADKRRWKSG
jgi:hypothetical protein